MIEVLSQDYIRAPLKLARLGNAYTFGTALRGGLLPVVSFLGPAIAGILNGSFVIEIFQIPGLRS